MSTATAHFDLIVIGGGPAGLIGATTAALAAKTVAVVDTRPDLGGAGVNTGTVPSKTLRETALAISGMKSRKLDGVDLSLRREATVADLLRREQNVKAGFNAAIAQRLTKRQIESRCGRASFIDPHTVRVVNEFDPSQDTVLSGTNILIATGSSPLRPAMFPFDGLTVHDSDTILKLNRLPKSIAVIGAGVIGSEYACTFAAIGTQTHLIDGRDVLLPFLDAEVSRALTEAMGRNGVQIQWKQKVVACVSGSAGITLTLTSGEALTVEAVLVAAGRTSNTDALNPPAAGVPVGERGLLVVDEHYRTAVPHIYAAGDVIGFPALASTSMEQARRAIRHAISPASVGGQTLSLLPNGIYTIPEASMVGETEQSLQKKGVEYVVGRAAYRDNARGRIIGDDEGFLKLLFRRGDLKLLGVHVMGEQATDIVHIGLIAMLTGSSAHLFDEACFNVPTLGALYKYAAADAIYGISILG